MNCFRPLFRLTFVSALFVSFLFFFAQQVFAAPTAPEAVFTYSGRLFDDNGVPLGDEMVNMQFHFYTAVSGGTCVWSNADTDCLSDGNTSVSLSDGLFSVQLGGSGMSTVDPVIFTEHSVLYLEVSVEGETLSPRKMLTASPFSMNAYSVQGYTPDSDVGPLELLRTDADGRIVLSGVTDLSNGVQDAPLRIDVASSDATDDGDVLFAITADDGASSYFTVTRDYIITGEALILTDTGTGSANTILSYEGLNVSAQHYGTDIAAWNADSDPLLQVLFSEDGDEVFAVGEQVVGIQIDLQNRYTLDAGGNNLTGLEIMMGNGGSGQSSGIRIAGSPEYGVLMSGYTSAALRFESSGTALSSDLNYDIAVDPGGSGDLKLSATGGSKFFIDTNGIAAADTGYFAISSSSSTTIGTALDAGIYLDFDTNTTVSNTDFYPLYISSDNGGGGAIYLEGCNNGGGGSCDDGADWTQNGLVFRDYQRDLTTATDPLGEGDFWLDIVPQGDGGVRVDLDVTDGMAVWDDADSKKFSVTSSILQGDADRELFEVERGNGGVDFDGVVARISNLENSSGSDGTALMVDNEGGGDSSGVIISQRQVGVADTLSPLASAHALVIKVDESSSNDDSVVIYSDADGTPDVEFTFENDGDAFADGSFTGGGADLAEFFESDDATLGGHDVVCRDEGNNAVRRCSLGERNVIGVISTNPAFIGNNVAGAGVDLRTDPRYRLVGLVGQVETFVTAADGAIAVGDALTASAFTPGAAGKAHGPGYIVGRALEPLSAGTGTIKVLVQPMWWAGDVFTARGDVTEVASDLRLASAASAAVPLLSSPGLQFAGSVWGGAEATAVGFDMQTRVDTADTYAMVWSSLEGDSLMELRSTGDLLVTGRLYPGDHGVAQDDAYIYYDAAGGGYMRTNAAGWSVGSYDFAETYPSSDALAPGDLVEFSDVDGAVRRSSGVPYSNRIVGIVSTRPGFLAGELTEGNYPVALSGRVPAKVSAENGAVAVGDPLTSSSLAGVLMKATEPGPVVGYALSGLSAGMGEVTVFVRPTYYDGSSALAAEGVGGAQTAQSLQLSGDLTMSAGVLRGVGRIEGIGSAWSIAEDGTLRTRGAIEQVTVGHGGDLITTTVPGTFGRTVTLSGTAILQNGRAEVQFAPEYLAIVSPTLAPRVVVTPYALVSSVAVIERSPMGFVIASGGGESGVAVDWYAVAPHKDDELSWPTEQPVAPPPIVVEELPVSEDVPSEELVLDVPADSEVTVPVEEPVAEPVVVE